MTMTPDQIEARFQRIEAILASSAERDAERDQRMDDLAENVQILTVSMNRLAESVVDYSRWKVETDQRFTIILEEVRAFNRRVDILENR